jgi:hypothetical protein
MVKKKKRYIPKKFIYIDKDDTQTIALQGKSGRMMGRRVVKKGEKGDRTFPRRVRGGEKGSKKYGGWIMGRSPPIKVRASKKRRGTIRRNI